LWYYSQIEDEKVINSHVIDALDLSTLTGNFVDTKKMIFMK